MGDQTSAASRTFSLDGLIGAVCFTGVDPPDDAAALQELAQLRTLHAFSRRCRFVTFCMVNQSRIWSNILLGVTGDFAEVEHTQGTCKPQPLAGLSNRKTSRVLQHPACERACSCWHAAQTHTAMGKLDRDPNMQVRYDSVTTASK